MKVLVIGQGGREHALCWKIRQSAQVKTVFCAPGNPGTARVAENVALSMEDIASLANFAEKEAIDLTVVGPELPLSLGIVDAFTSRGLRIFGPQKAAAQLESSKLFAKNIMLEAGVQTAKAHTCHSREELVEYVRSMELPFVLKADGLASGKGVVVCHSREDVSHAVEHLCGELKASMIIVEEFLSGREASFMVATDGERIIPLATSHDYKRLLDHDQGPNTGGMGCVSPTPVLSEDLSRRVVTEVIEPVLRTMRERGTPFRGFLYAGLMINGENISVLEFNARLGDPETQGILRRLDGDLCQLLYALCEAPRNTAQRTTAPRTPNAVGGEGSGGAATSISWSSASAVCLVLASPGYPQAPELGDEIHGIELAEQRPGVVVFHAGTAVETASGARGGPTLKTSGGRVLSVTALAPSVEEASRVAYQAADLIQFRGRQLRRDIGT